MEVVVVVALVAAVFFGFWVVHLILMVFEWLLLVFDWIMCVILKDIATDRRLG